MTVDKKAWGTAQSELHSLLAIALYVSRFFSRVQALPELAVVQMERQRIRLESVDVKLPAPK
jgi:hypothetical protein